MEATFKIEPGGAEMRVKTDKAKRCVAMTIITGIDSMSPQNRQHDAYSVSPSTARAISSALMGAAAEV